MKKIVALLLTLIMLVSIVPLGALAKDTTSTEEISIPEYYTETQSSDNRFLIMIEGETINVFKQYKITPNKGWGLWVNVTSLDNSFTVTVRNSKGTAVWSETVPAGGQVKQKILNSCDGNYYTVDFLGTGKFKVVGGLYQTEVI